jgi:NADH dehydrogenase (ubiquinone) Fe-S protein 3
LELVKMKNLTEYLFLIAPNFFYIVEEKNKNTKIFIKQDLLKIFVFFIKYHTNLNVSVLTDIFAVDNVKNLFRFTVYYQFISLFFNYRLEIVCNIKNEIAGIESIVSCFNSANWLEREVWDLMGIYFYNHPDLRRILTDYGFQGFPLRKDFPLTGYEELKYDNEKKRIVSERIQISQEFRFFEFKSPWKKH